MNIFKFENQYKDILENIEEWAYLRIDVANYLRDKNNNDIIKRESAKKFISKLQKIRTIFYGFNNWFKKYDGLVFSDSAERRILDGKYIDKISDDIIDRLKPNKNLMIELPNPKHYNLGSAKTKYIASESLIKLLTFVIKNISLKNKINIEKLNYIFDKENIEFDYQETILNFNYSYKIYKLLLKIYNPKYIIVNCHYCRFGLIKAANDLDIKTIEVQHGVINQAHYAYVSELKLNSLYFPKQLLSFGKNETILQNRVIKDVYPIGSFYLEYFLKKFLPNQEFLNKIESFKYKIGVSMQDQKEWEVKGILDFIVECAKKDENILYVIIPRRQKQFQYEFPKNIIIYDKLDCYNTILHCDVHATLYSSCSLESPSLGIPNILIDIKGYATEYYKNILSDKHTNIVNSMKDFFLAVDFLVSLEREYIQKNNENIFIQNYDDNINRFIRKLKREN